MGYRVDMVVVTLTAEVEFEGLVTSAFSFKPTDDDAELVKLLVVKEAALDLKAVQDAGAQQPFNFG